jgi:murein DD-endopeptidase MepM/ murein hydrolase activator NlpD
LDSYAATHAPALDMVREPNQQGTEGSLVVASASGVVKQSFYHENHPGTNDGAGNMIQIDHGGGWFTTYLHLQSRSVQVGQKVAQGQEIGHVGKTGKTSNGHPHLHFEQAFDRNGDGYATWGEQNSERVPAVLHGENYGENSKTWKNVTSHNNCGS